MSVSLEWYVQDYVIYEVVKGGITLEETATLSGRLMEFVNDSQAGQVHVLINLMGMESNPEHARLLGTTITPLFLQRNIGWIVIFSTDDTVKSYMSASVTQMFQSRFHIAENLYDALDFLQQKDTSLPPIPEIDDIDEDLTRPHRPDSPPSE